jgi:glycosyltransferase involved in cell wall biosynthesis
MDTDALIGINATSLLYPNTYAAQYTYYLIQALQTLLPNQPLLFHHNRWTHNLHTKPWFSPALVKTLLKHMPYAHQLNYFLQRSAFVKGIHARKVNLYHEPHFVTHPVNKPSVLSIHDLSYIRHPENHSIYAAKHLQQQVPRSIANASHILTSSIFVKNEVITYYDVPPEKITVAWPGIQPIFRPLLPAECNTVLAFYRLHYGRYILVCGTGTSYQNIKTVLSAFLSLPPASRRCFPLVIVGMPKNHIRRLTRKIRSLIERSEIILLNPIPPAHLPVLYSGAKIFLYPPRYEGFPLPPLQAMACGTPVIASNVAALPEVIGDAGLLVRAEKIDHWMHSIQTLLENPTVCNEYGQLGQKYAALFSWERCARQTMLAYKSVLEGGG